MIGKKIHVDLPFLDIDAIIIEEYVNETPIRYIVKCISTFEPTYIIFAGEFTVLGDTND